MVETYYPPAQYDPIPVQTEGTYLDYLKTKSFKDVGYFLESYVAAGGVVNINEERNNWIDATDIVAVLNDQVMARNGASFQTKLASATYYLDFKDGDFTWSTSHPSGTAYVDYLTIATVTTKPNKTVNVITDTAGDRRGFRLKPEFPIPDLIERGLNVKHLPPPYVSAIGDGIRDDTVSIQSAIDLVGVGGTVVFPYGVYRTTSTLYVRKETKIDATQSIIYCDHSGTGILVQRPGGVLGFNTSEQVYIDVSITRSGTYTSSTSAIALRIVDCFRGVFKSNQIFTHGIGILLEGLTSGVTYCQFYLGIMKDCYVGIKTKTTTPGYVTENTFIGGQGGSGNVSSSVNAYAHIWMDASGSGIQDNNHFYAFAMEGFHQHGVIVDGDSIGNTFHGCRFEMPFATYYVKLTIGSQSNSFQDCYGLVDGLKNGKFFDAGSYNHISGGNNVTACRVEYSDQRVYAYITPGFQKPTGYNAGITVLTPGVNTIFPLAVSTATFNIDLSRGDHIQISLAAGVTVTGITFSNVPVVGGKVTLSFLQAGSGGGNSITGFPSLFLGSRTVAPVARNNGRDVYYGTTGTVGGEFYAQSQYAN